MAPRTTARRLAPALLLALALALAAALPPAPGLAASLATLTRAFQRSPANTSGSVLTDLVVAGERAFFRADDGTHGVELWVSNGTPGGTALVADLAPGDASSDLKTLKPFGANLIFQSSDYRQIWFTDGTEAGTRRIYDQQGGLNTMVLWAAAGGLFYFAYPLEGGGLELYRTDGTAAGILQLATIPTGSGPLTTFAAIGDRLAFAWNQAGSSAPPDYRLWLSDGTAAGTQALISLAGKPEQLLAAGDRLYFTIYDDVAFSSQIYRSDGTAAGTVALGTVGGQVKAMTPVGDTLFLSTGSALYRLDAAATSATKVTSNPALPYIVSMVEANGTLFMLTMDHCSLARSDGTNAGTYVIKALKPGKDCQTNGSTGRLVSTGDAVLFVYWQPLVYAYINDRDELFLSDGTLTGTLQLDAPAKYLGVPLLIGERLIIKGQAGYGDDASTPDYGVWELSPLLGAGGAQATIRPGAGETLRHSGAQGVIEARLGPGAVTDPTSLVLTPASAPTAPEGLTFAGQAFTLDAYRSGAQLPSFSFAAPITLTMTYLDAAVAGQPEDQLRLYYKSGERWIDAATSCTPTSPYVRDLAANRLSVAVCHLTEFALFSGAGEHKVYLPGVLR